MYISNSFSIHHACCTTSICTRYNMSAPAVAQFVTAPYTYIHQNPFAKSLLQGFYWISGPSPFQQEEKDPDSFSSYFVLQCLS
jgi:hypothetical protein